MTLEIIVVVIWALRIHVRLAQRLVRSCLDPPGLGASRPPCVWAETRGASAGLARPAHDPAFLFVSWDLLHSQQLQMYP